MMAETQKSVPADGSPKLPPQTRIGTIELTVADLDRSVSYYEGVVGLRTQSRADGFAVLGASGEGLLRLIESPGARPAKGCSGLYHFALLVPRRADLARWLAHAQRERIPLVGLSDHFVSEAIYLNDPDEHGIEIYWDRPRELWEGQVAQRMTTLPLDSQSLLSELGDLRSEPFEGMPEGATVGHVHLRVADVEQAVAFYEGQLGFDLVASYGAQAAFLSAGGYHHHVGVNSWESAGRGHAPPGSATLVSASIVLPDLDAREQAGRAAAAAGTDVERVAGGLLVHDASGNPLLLTEPVAAPS